MSLLRGVVQIPFQTTFDELGKGNFQWSGRHRSQTQVGLKKKKMRKRHNECRLCSRNLVVNERWVIYRKEHRVQKSLVVLFCFKDGRYFKIFKCWWKIRGMNKLKLEGTEESAINPGPWTVRRDGNGYLDWEILYRNEGDSICLVSSTWSAILDA